MRVLRCEHWPLDKALIRGLLTATEQLRRHSPQTQATKAQMERSNSEERDQIDRPPVPHEDEAASEPGTSSEAFQSDDWWRASAPESDWAQPVSTLQPRKSGSGRKSARLMFIFAAAQICFR